MIDRTSRRRSIPTARVACRGRDRAIGIAIRQGLDTRDQDIGNRPRPGEDASGLCEIGLMPVFRFDQRLDALQDDHLRIGRRRIVVIGDKPRRRGDDAVGRLVSAAPASASAVGHRGGGSATLRLHRGRARASPRDSGLSTTTATSGSTTWVSASSARFGALGAAGRHRRRHRRRPGRFPTVNGTGDSSQPSVAAPGRARPGHDQSATSWSGFTRDRVFTHSGTDGLPGQRTTGIASIAGDSNRSA